MSYLRNYAPDAVLSSSPEYHDNDIKAWFSKLSSYDWALYKNLDKMAREMNAAQKPGGPILRTDDIHEFTDSMYFNETGLPIAPGQNLDASHRHHAQLMAIYPLGLLSPDNKADKTIINNSLRHLEKMGTRLWCGYSFSWAACLYARARESNNAAKMLYIFAENFVSKNSFHLNGDQKGGEYSDFKYRPFTLEGNFAFAQGLQEMLIQSYNGYIEIFPAVPETWRDVAFKTLRTEGAILVSAKKVNGNVDEVELFAEKEGIVKLKLPFKNFIIADNNNCSLKNTGNGFVELNFKSVGNIDLKNTDQ
jgi:alpha-L-fucosidase 2